MLLVAVAPGYRFVVCAHPMPAAVLQPRTYAPDTSRPLIPLPRPPSELGGSALPDQCSAGEVGVDAEDTEVVWLPDVAAAVGAATGAARLAPGGVVLPVGAQAQRDGVQSNAACPPLHAQQSAAFLHCPPEWLPAEGVLAGLPRMALALAASRTGVSAQCGCLVLARKDAAAPEAMTDHHAAFLCFQPPQPAPPMSCDPVDTPVNALTPPAVVIAATMPQHARLRFGHKRLEQTGQAEAWNFPTSLWVSGVEVPAEIAAAEFVPSAEVAVGNRPAARPAVTSHADLNYPFCEPSTRPNTLLDHYHMLTGSVCSASDPCVFTALSRQEAGKLGGKGDYTLPIGRLPLRVYRAFAYAQTGEIEEFATEDGLPYWFNRRTGETYWERPALCDVEGEAQRLEAEGRAHGGRLPKGSPHGEGEAEGGYYDAERVRRYMLVKHHDMVAELRRAEREGTSIIPLSTGPAVEPERPAAPAHRAPAAVPPLPLPTAAAAAAAAAAPVMAAPATTAAVSPAPAAAAASPAPAPAGLATSVDPQLVASLASALSTVLPQLQAGSLQGGGATGALDAQALLNLGLGLGLGLGLRQQAAAAVPAVPATATTPAASAVAAAPASAAAHAAATSAPPAPAPATASEAQPTPMPDAEEGLERARAQPFLTHSPAGQGTAYHPAPDGHTVATPGAPVAVLLPKAKLPRRFVDALRAPRTAAQRTDYIAEQPNVNTAVLAGVVKAPEVIEEWMHKVRAHATLRCALASHTDRAMLRCAVPRCATLLFAPRTGIRSMVGLRPRYLRGLHPGPERGGGAARHLCAWQGGC